MHAFVLALNLWVGTESANIEVPARGFRNDETMRRVWYRSHHPVLTGKRTPDQERKTEARVLQIAERLQNEPNRDKERQTEAKLQQALEQLLEERLKQFEQPPML